MVSFFRTINYSGEKIVASLDPLQKKKEKEKNELTDLTLKIVSPEEPNQCSMCDASFDIVKNIEAIHEHDWNVL